MVLWPRWPLGTSRSVTKTIYRTLQLMLQYSIHNWCKHVLPPESVTWENMALFSYSLHSQNLTGSSGQARSVSLPEESCSTLISFPIILTVCLQKNKQTTTTKNKKHHKLLCGPKRKELHLYWNKQQDYWSQAWLKQYYVCKTAVSRNKRSGTLQHIFIRKDRTEQEE